MTRSLATITTDQVHGFVELARTGSIRRAAKALHISEEGLRSRLLTLEERLHISLYEKERGRRADVRLTHAGQIFLHKAERFIAEAHSLTRLFDPGQLERGLQIASSQYLASYALIAVIRAFHAHHPSVAVRVFTRTEQQILASLQSETSLTLGFCAPIEYPTDLVYHHWFSTEWSFVAPIGHPLLRAQCVMLSELVDESLIMFEHGSTGRQHVLEAFYERSLSPRVTMEATSTQTVLRMVEAGLGVAIVPLLPSGVVTRGLDIGHTPLGDQIRPIDSGILSKSNWQDEICVQEFLNFAQANQP